MDNYNTKVFSWNEWQWTDKSLLGNGEYGAVYKAGKRVEDETIYSAIKIVSIPKNPVEEIRESLCNGKTAEEIQKYIDNKKDKYIEEVKMMYELHGGSNIVNIEEFGVKTENYKIEIGEKKFNIEAYILHIRMEYLESFEEYMTNNTLSRKQIIKFGLDICNALEYCQEQNIIHRDIKPSNIMIHRIGKIINYKLIDFGLARHLENGLAKSFVGTASYMAPEINGVLNKKYDITVDYYALGLILYQLLNENRLPFQEKNNPDMQWAISQRDAGEEFPEPEHNWEGLFQIIEKCCAFKPEQRYQTAAEIKEDLQKLQDNFIKLHNPVIKTEGKNEIITWDCFFYGTALQESENISFELKIKLDFAEWDDDDETFIDGDLYRKIPIDENRSMVFKYEPVLWRALEVSEKEVLALSEKIISYGSYPVVSKEREEDFRYFILNEEQLQNPKYGFSPKLELADVAREGRYTELVEILGGENHNSWWIESKDPTIIQRIIPSGMACEFPKEEKAGVRHAVRIDLEELDQSDYAGKKTVKRRKREF